MIVHVVRGGLHGASFIPSHCGQSALSRLSLGLNRKNENETVMLCVRLAAIDGDFSRRGHVRLLV